MSKQMKDVLEHLLEVRDVKRPPKPLISVSNHTFLLNRLRFRLRESPKSVPIPEGLITLARFMCPRVFALKRVEGRTDG